MDRAAGNQEEQPFIAAAQLGGGIGGAGAQCHADAGEAGAVLHAHAPTDGQIGHGRVNDPVTGNQILNLTGRFVSGAGLNKNAFVEGFTVGQIGFDAVAAGVSANEQAVNGPGLFPRLILSAEGAEIGRRRQFRRRRMVRAARLQQDIIAQGLGVGAEGADHIEAAAAQPFKPDGMQFDRRDGVGQGIQNRLAPGCIGRRQIGNGAAVPDGRGQKGRGQIETDHGRGSFFTNFPLQEFHGHTTPPFFHSDRCIIS